MSVTFLIGDRDYVVNDAGAHWLVQHLRGWSNVDETNRETRPKGADPYQIERAGQSSARASHVEDA